MRFFKLTNETLYMQLYKPPIVLSLKMPVEYSRMQS